MKKPNVILLGMVAFLVAVNLLLVPYLHRREATRIVKTVLQCWTSGDLPQAYSYWQDANNSPPVDGLTSYTINGKKFGKKNGEHYAQFVVTLNFPTGSTLPSGKEWAFELQTTRLGWKIINFHPYGAAN